MREVKQNKEHLERQLAPLRRHLEHLHCGYCSSAADFLLFLLKDSVASAVHGDTCVSPFLVFSVTLSSSKRCEDPTCQSSSLTRIPYGSKVASSVN